VTEVVFWFSTVVWSYIVALVFTNQLTELPFELLCIAFGIIIGEVLVGETKRLSVFVEQVDHLFDDAHALPLPPLVLLCLFLPRPPCDSVGMKEIDETTPALLAAWRDWAAGREVDPQGICDRWRCNNIDPEKPMGSS